MSQSIDMLRKLTEEISTKKLNVEMIDITDEYGTKLIVIQLVEAQALIAEMQASETAASIVNDGKDKQIAKLTKDLKEIVSILKTANQEIDSMKAGVEEDGQSTSMTRKE